MTRVRTEQEAPRKWATDPWARRQGFVAEERGARVQHVTVLFLWFNHFEISSLTRGK